MHFKININSYIEECLFDIFYMTIGRKITKDKVKHIFASRDEDRRELN